MIAPIEVLAAAFALAVAVGLGTLVHELLHAGILRAAGAHVEIHWGGDGRSGRHWASIAGSLAAVRLRGIPESLSPWQLRVASLSPLLLAAPLAVIGLGAVPDPFAGENVVLQLLLIGWLACALPSPQDFSMFWHAERIVAAGGVPDAIEDS